MEIHNLILCLTNIQANIIFILIKILTKKLQTIPISSIEMVTSGIAAYLKK